MAGLVLKLKADPGERLDFSGLTPDVLAAGATPNLANQIVGTTRRGIKLSDIFDIRASSSDETTIDAAGAVIDGLGTGMTGGLLVVNGDAGAFVGARMKGGAIEIRGSAGNHVGADMSGGLIHVAGSAGDSTGGLAPGKRFGMTGGTIVIDGNAGARTGEKMRRGLILVRGATGAQTGARMLGGTIVVEGKVGPDSGRLMRRGTIIAGTADVPATFADCGTHDLAILGVMARDWARELGPLAPKLAPRRVRRYAGDLATIGKGELLLPA